MARKTLPDWERKKRRVLYLTDGVYRKVLDYLEKDGPGDIQSVMNPRLGTFLETPPVVPASHPIRPVPSPSKPPLASRSAPKEEAGGYHGRGPMFKTEKRKTPERKPVLFGEDGEALEEEG